MRTNFEIHKLSGAFLAEQNLVAWCDLFHPTDSIYIDPIFGSFEGREAIAKWFVPTMARAGKWSGGPIGEVHFTDDVAFCEAKLVVGDKSHEFAWVQRYSMGSIVYRRDYYDPRLLMDLGA